MAEVVSLVEASDAEESLAASLSTEHLGTLSFRRQVGPYQLDRLIGRGGMGAVFLAHRADGEFEQEVAIKLIDFPLAKEQFREPFRMERQILAGLNHPYIARLLDGGVSADGELYLAMEYVAGTSIIRYCKQNQLPLRARLRLFTKVCEGCTLRSSEFGNPSRLEARQYPRSRRWHAAPARFRHGKATDAPALERGVHLDRLAVIYASVR